MKIANNLYKVTLKKSEEAVTGRMSIGWMATSMRHFGLRKMILDEYRQEKGSNREKDAYEKVMTAAMMMVSGGQRLENVENLWVKKWIVGEFGMGRNGMCGHGD